MRESRWNLVLILVLMGSFIGCSGGGKIKDIEVGISTNSSSDKTLQTDSAVDNNNTKTDTTIPQTHLYILKSRVDVKDDHNETTTFEYVGNYVAQSTTTNSDNVEPIIKSYEYNATSKVLSVKVKNLIGEWELAQKATFADGEMDMGVKMGDATHKYLFNVFAPITHFKKVHVVENIKDIEKELYNTDKYFYTNGKLSKITSGYYDNLEGGAFHTEIENALAQQTHRFSYSSDHKEVKEMDGNKIVRVYRFDEIEE